MYLISCCQSTAHNLRLEREEHHLDANHHDTSYHEPRRRCRKPLIYRDTRTATRTDLAGVRTCVLCTEGRDLSFIVHEGVVLVIGHRQLTINPNILYERTWLTPCISLIAPNHA